MNYLKSNLKINFKSTFIRLLSSYIILTSIILFISTITLYNGYKRQIIKNSTNSSERILNQANYYIDYTLNWAKLFTYQLYLSQDVSALMYSQQDKPNAIGENSGVTSLSFLPPSIQSVYIYNNNNGKIYSSISSPVEINNFYDHEILNYLKNSSETFTTKLVPRKIDTVLKNNLKYNKNVLTIALCNSKNPKNSLPDGAIVVNLDSAEIQKYFRTISEDGSDLFAIDENGNVVMHSNSNMFLKNISENSYIQNIFKSKDSKGSFLSTIDGTPCVVTYSSSSRLGLKFISITPYKTLLESINGMTRLLVIMFIMLFIIGIIFSYIVSKKIYSPIDKIVKQVKSKSPIAIDSEDALESNELDLLSLAIDNMLNERTTLKNLTNEDASFIRKRLLEALLLNDVVTIKDIKTKLDELDIKISDEGNLVIAFKIDKIKDFYSRYDHDDRNLIRFGICNICHEIASKYFYNECIFINNTHMALILNISDENSTEHLGLIFKFIKEIQELVSLYYKISLSAGIGCYVHDINQLSISYKVSINCLNYTLKFGTNSILYYKEINSHINNDYHYDEAMETLLFNSIKLGNINNIENQLDKILDTISTYSYSNMLLSISHLALHSKKLVDSLHFVNNEPSNMSLKSFLNNLDKLETLDEVKSWFMSFYTNFVNQLNERKSNKSDTIVSTTLKYIEENYSNPCLSAESIADYVDISPNYLRTIFKNAVNKSLSNYISEFRFNKAKVLLETTDLTVSDISTTVGFSNSNYFYTAFKKNYGISPNQYRTNYKNNSTAS